MNEVINVSEIFGSDVFNEATMRQRLSAGVYSAWRTCIDTGAELQLSTANVPFLSIPQLPCERFQEPPAL